MNKLFQIILFAGFVFAIQAKTEGEMKLYFIELGVECAKSYRVTPEEMESLHKHELPPGDTANCFLACIYKKANWLDDKGMYNVKGAHEMADKEVEPSKIENAKTLFDMCAKVNDESVSDGDKGCDRAGHLFKCVTQNAEKHGFHIQ